MLKNIFIKTNTVIVSFIYLYIALITWHLLQMILYIPDLHRAGPWVAQSVNLTVIKTVLALLRSIK